MTDEASPSQTDWQAPGISTLYLFRAGFSAVWVTSVYVVASSARGSTPSILAGALLVIYPLSDVVATIFDIRATRAAPAAPIPQYANIAAGSTAACAILIALFSDLPAAITAFGVWAITAGGLQLLLAERRRGAFRGQWLMIISGAGSVLAGITFLGWTGSTKTGLAVLAQYSAGAAPSGTSCARSGSYTPRDQSPPSPQATTGL